MNFFEDMNRQMREHEERLKKEREEASAFADRLLAHMADSVPADFKLVTLVIAMSKAFVDDWSTGVAAGNQINFDGYVETVLKSVDSTLYTELTRMVIERART